MVEQKQAQEVNQDKEVQQRLLNELGKIYGEAPVGVCYLDADLRFLHVNDWLANINGVPVEAHIGRTIREVLPDVAAGVESQFRHVIETGEPIIQGRVHAETPAHPGVKKHYIHNYYPVRQDGTVVGVTCTVEDVTRLMDANEALEVSERRYRALLEAIPDVIFRLKPDATIVDYVADTTEEPSSTPQKISGKTMNEVFSTEVDATGVIDRALVTGDVQSIDYAVYAVGEPIHYEARVAKSAAQEVVWVARDITERKKAEEAIREQLDGLERHVEERARALQESERQVKLLFDSAAAAIYQLDLDGRCTLCNSACVETLGYASETDLLGMNMHSLIHHTRPDGSHYPSTECRIYQGFRSGEGTHVDDEVLWRADGTSFPVEYWSRPVRRDSEVIGSVVTFIDISHRKAAQLQREKLEEQLRHSQKMEAIGQLAGGVAHDFNNLLTAINGYSDLLLADLRPDDPLHHGLSEINKAGTRAAALTGQLLAYSRKQVLQPQVVDLGENVMALEDMLRRLIGENIGLHIRRSPDPHNVEVDSGQIDQVIVNLVVNARDAVPRGGNITIGIENITFDEHTGTPLEDLPTGEFVMLSVADDGVGMDKETLSRIFEPFFTSAGTEQGTGLGLSTVFGIVKQSNGGIEVESEPGNGSVFRVYLPQIEASVPVEETLVVTPVEGQENILLVEDDTMIRTLLSRVLRSWGYSILAAQNGAEALLIAERYDGTIDLLITDVIMPQMSGHELVDRLAPLRPDMAVLYISGYNDQMMDQVLDHSQQFLQKPFLPKDVATKIRQILDGHTT